MKIQTIVRTWTLITAALVLAACVLPASTRPGLSVELLAPSPGLVFNLGHSARIQAEALAPGGGVTRMIFYANGIVVGEDSTIATPRGDIPPMYFVGEVSWTPTAAGEYLVQAEAFRSDGSAFSAATRVCVVDLGDPNAGIVLWYGFTGPCEIPAPNPDAPSGLAVGMTAHAIPASLAYFWMCPASIVNPTIAFEAIVDDPSDRVVFVTIGYSVPLRGDPETEYSDSLGLNWTASSASGAKIFSGTTSDLTSTLNGELQGDGGIVTWTARAIGRGGEILATDGPHDILASPCVAAVVGAAMPIIAEPSETLAPSPTSTNTATLTPFIPTKTTAPTLKPFVPTDTLQPFVPSDTPAGGSCKDYKTKETCTENKCTWTDSCNK